MNIKEAAEKTGISAHTLIFYEKSGLFPKLEKPKAGFLNSQTLTLAF
jgi:DNA-binding transcriptional MerR regulator